MFAIRMEVENQVYTYGIYDDRDRANEIAMEVRDRRGIWVWVEEI